MMKRNLGSRKNMFSATALALLLCFSRAAYTDADQPLIADWMGTLQAGGAELRVAFRVREVDGELSAVMDSLDQNVTGIPARVSVSDAGVISFTVRAASASFRGQLEEDESAITGVWEQPGFQQQLNLIRQQEQREVTTLTPLHLDTGLTNTLQGEWTGEVQVAGQGFIRLVMLVLVAEDGGMIGELDSPDQGVMGIPFALASEQGKIHFESPSLNLRFSSSLVRGVQSLDGTLEQGGMSTALTLSKTIN